MSVRRDDATDKIIGCVFSQLYFTSFTTNCNFLKLKSFLLNWQTSYVKLEIRYKVDKTSVCVTLLFFNNFFLSKTAHSSSCSWFCVVFTASVSDPVRVEAPHQQTIGDKWRNERLTSAEDDTHSHSFMGLGLLPWEDDGRMTRLAFKGNCGPKNLFEQRSIINQCVGEEGEITRAVRVVLTNKANRSRQWMHTDKRLWLWHWPVPNIQIRVHLVGRLVLFMSAAPSHIISALSSAALSSLTRQLCPRSVNKTHDKPPKRTLYTYICAFSDNVTTIKS